MTVAERVHIDDCGDAAIRVVAADADRELCWRIVHGLAASLRRDPVPGVVTTIPTYDALLVELDPVLTSHHRTRGALIERLPDAAGWQPPEPRTFRIPVRYGGSYQGDLEVVAGLLGIAPEEVIAIHSGQPLMMRCFGSPGGAPMLDGPPFGAPIPRLGSPRAHVEAGAVAVAGRQAVISARPAPGGWQVLGRTPTRLVDLARPGLVPYRPGDRFEFHPITDAEWRAHVERPV
ncbi:5-oxoprolinase subunit B family protein [Enemella evansiae]|uniref:5-oxoprolinase subunit B family protein n=1 Tax=Enemella evansiae TaxID=2016499 RepID=UPI001E36A7E2|nr:carboxyltransferase domain-containing protein [Enemella evansiae]